MAYKRMTGIFFTFSAQRKSRGSTADCGSVGKWPIYRQQTSSETRGGTQVTGKGRKWDPKMMILPGLKNFSLKDTERVSSDSRPLFERLLFPFAWISTWVVKVVTLAKLYLYSSPIDWAWAFYKKALICYFKFFEVDANLCVTDIKQCCFEKVLVASGGTNKISRDKFKVVLQNHREHSRAFIVFCLLTEIVRISFLYTAPWGQQEPHKRSPSENDKGKLLFIWYLTQVIGTQFKLMTFIPYN